MEKISCIFNCKAPSSIVINESGYEGNKCFNCALIYISPRPSMQEVLDIYGHNDAHISAQSHITQSYFKYLHSVHTLSIIKKYKKCGALLEIGAGGGHFLAQAKRDGFEPYAIELNPTQAVFISEKQKIPCEEKPFSLSSFGSTKFDVIYHSDVISHLHDPHAAFLMMHEKLNDGGFLIFETGNLSDVHRRYYSLFNSFQYPDHLFFFGEQNVKTLLEQSGFVFKKMYRYSIVLHLIMLKLIGLLSKKNKQQKLSPASSGNQQTTRSSAKDFLKDTYHIMLYTMRYRLGALLPKKNRPQTIIVIAEKN
ncbi:class I SAM-dependent methyltransferase [Candidatus Dependentiae bacterium]|nr:class I SAM-dependent methyltransferase [Candidatus Dependentiae bacterium]